MMRPTKLVVVAVVASLLMLLPACGEAATEAGVLAQIDVADASCDGVHNPILLAHLMDYDGKWLKLGAADLVSAETGRESSPQAHVVVDVEGMDAELVTLEDPLARAATIRLDRFERLAIASAMGGTVYAQFLDQGAGTPQAVKGLAWIDSKGGVHFLGDCAPKYWTEPLSRFAADIGWTGTEEQLLVELIAGGAVVDQLEVWTFGAEQARWVDIDPELRHFMDAPPRQIEKYNRGFLDVTVPDSWRTTDTLLCSFVPEGGWNPCVRLAEESLLESKVEIPVHHSDDQPLEIWLRDVADEAVGVLIGSVSFSAGNEAVSIELVDPVPSIRGVDGSLVEVAEGWMLTSDAFLSP